MTVKALQPMGQAGSGLDIAKIRADFPVFQRQINGKPLTFLDSAASAQKPRHVITAMTDMMENHYANIHRGVYTLSAEATTAYEDAREKLAHFINARSEKEIVFTRNATEAINLVAATWGRKNLQRGDKVIVTELEHHANIVPWQMLETDIGIELVVVPIDDHGTIDMDVLAQHVKDDATRLVSVSAMSNALGVILPVMQIVKLAREYGKKILIDACQSIVHEKTDVQDLDCDWLVFSGHKLYGPTGIGVLYGRYELLEQMPPYQGGGDMIDVVSFSGTTFAEPPARFEAGTPAIIEAAGLAAALDYITAIGFDAIAAHEDSVRLYGEEKLSAIDGLTLLGMAPHRGGILSFTLEGAHPHDVGTILDKCGVAVRTGHHCAQPLMQRLGVPATVRASLGLYNYKDDIDRLVDGLRLVKELLG